jgi:DNA-binding protein YbaB
MAWSRDDSPDVVTVTLMNRQQRRKNKGLLGSMNDMDSAVEQVKLLRDDMEAAKNELKAATTTVSNGPVTVTVNGDGRLVSINIALPDAAGSVIAASVLSAVQKAQDEMGDLTAKKMAPFTALTDLV